MAGAGGGADNVSCVLNLNAKVTQHSRGRAAWQEVGTLVSSVQDQACVGSVVGTLDHESIA